jgi:hypothetical protein
MTESMDSEPELSIESWMTTMDYLTPDYLNQENEPELEFESWMFETL